MPRFSKYDGAGNDFVLVRAEEVGLDDPGALARRVCPRSGGVGVDGLVLVRGLDVDLVRLRFFNPDGSEFSTCGNGTRCAARYAVDRGLVEGPELGLVTDAGEVRARAGDEVRLEYRVSALGATVEREVEVPYGGGTRRGWLVQVGTPHLVLPVDRLPGEAFAELAGAIRHAPTLGAEGANVDVVALGGGDAGEIRTFERGVEGETLACGSGAMATALALRTAGLTGDALELVTRSGARLRVELPAADRGGDTGASIALTGPASWVFDGVFPDSPPDDGR